MAELPAFVCQLPDSSQVLQRAWQASRLKTLQSMSQRLPSQDQLDAAADIIFRESTHGCLTYCQYTKAVLKTQSLGVQLGLRPTIFLQMQCNGKGAVPVSTVLGYLLQRSSMCRLRIHANCYDLRGTGFLTPSQLHSFLQHLLLRLMGAAEVEQYLPIEAYAVLCSARISLCLARAGRVLIRSLVTSTVLAELLQAASSSPEDDDSSSNLSSQGADSWFAPASAGRLWSAFVEHAGDQGTGLTQQQFMRSCTDSMTPTFTARAFDELCSREAQPGSAEFGRPRVLGFAGFAAFHAAWQHRMEPGALRFLFPCLCQPGSSSLYREDVLRHMTDVLRMWAETGAPDEMRPEDVCDEVFDVVKPHNPARIACADLLRCGMGGEVLGLMADVSAFYDWESRELTLQQIDLA